MKNIYLTGAEFEPIYTNKINGFLKNAINIPKMFEPLWNLNISNIKTKTGFCNPLVHRCSAFNKLTLSIRSSLYT